MLATLLLTNSLYVCLIDVSPAADWALTPAAILFGVGPLAVALRAIRVNGFGHPLCWVLVALNCGLSVVLLAIQHRPGNGPELAMVAVLFSVYLSCTLHFWFAYRRGTAGAFISIAGFLAWASVFVVGPMMAAFYPNVPIESEVWNLPKYVVAVGMILIMLEDQIAHNKYLAFHDELTGLPNRRLFQDRLTIALERARRSNTKAALLVVDLDRFKQVNDTWGHHAGDLLLQQVSMLFVGRVRNCDTVARTGGDEFSVILEGICDGDSAQQVALSLVENLSEPLEIGGKLISIGASVGVAVYPDDAAEFEALCIAADMRMYDSKNIAREMKQRPPGKILPQSLIPEAARVASEGYSA
jgi:diguanylate cyclase (GGDEF)-like protein